MDREEDYSKEATTPSRESRKTMLSSKLKLRLSSSTTCRCSCSASSSSSSSTLRNKLQLNIPPSPLADLPITATLIQRNSNFQASRSQQEVLSCLEERQLDRPLRSASARHRLEEQASAQAQLAVSGRTGKIDFSILMQCNSIKYYNIVTCKRTQHLLFSSLSLGQ